MNERELLDAVSKLPKSIEPPRDLWPAIETRTSPMTSPAAAAGLSEVTFTTMTAVRWVRPSRSRRSFGSTTGCVPTPR